MDATLGQPPTRHSILTLSALHAFLIFSVTLMVARVVVRVTAFTLTSKGLSLPAADLSLTIVKVTIWITGFLVILNGLGIAITPILTALGIGALAVSLALQDTLSNFFSGIYILLDKLIQVGDKIRMESGQEGVVISIGWRTTRLHANTGEIVIIPNNKIVQSVVVNSTQASPISVIQSIKTVEPHEHKSAS